MLITAHVCKHHPEELAGDIGEFAILVTAKGVADVVVGADEARKHSRYTYIYIFFIYGNLNAVYIIMGWPDSLEKSPPPQKKN